MQEESGVKSGESNHSSKKSLKQWIKYIYEDQYKKLLIIPFIILLLAFAAIGYNIHSTGSFINKGMSLKGGTSITILSDTITAKEVETSLTGIGEIGTRTLSSSGKQLGVVIETDLTDEVKISEIKSELKQTYSLDDASLTIETMGSSLGSSFFKETTRALIFSFLFMAVVIFAYFRTFIPSLAVIISAFSDIVITVGVLDLLGIKVGTAGIAALLMLIGYSVDTDILLTVKVLKRKEGTVMDRIYSSIKTGLMMTLTAIIAISIGLIFSQNEITTQIMTILLIGLGADIFNTWIQNVGILRLYVERKHLK